MITPPAQFRSFQQRAEQMLGKPGRIQSLVAQATRKQANSGGVKLRELHGQLKLAMAMLSAWLAGDYRQISNTTLVMLVAALLYFVVPLDVIPDFLFGWGLVDDAAVLAYVFAQLQAEVEAFRLWQEQDGSSR